MCIVLDASCFSKVFNANDAEHPEFQPVLRWILEGDGCLVYGGRKYKTELAMARRYLRMFVELKNFGKVRVADDAKVDAHQARIESIVEVAKHNDPHLPAIICACGCRLVCTDDAKSCALLKERRCYSAGVAVPKLYMSAKNADLLRARNVATFCKPIARLSKGSREQLSDAIGAALS